MSVQLTHNCTTYSHRRPR